MSDLSRLRWRCRRGMRELDVVLLGPSEGAADGVQQKPLGFANDALGTILETCRDRPIRNHACHMCHRQTSSAAELGVPR